MKVNFLKASALSYALTLPASVFAQDDTIPTVIESNTCIKYEFDSEGKKFILPSFWQMERYNEIGKIKCKTTYTVTPTKKFKHIASNLLGAYLHSAVKSTALRLEQDSGENYIRVDQDPKMVLSFTG